MTNLNKFIELYLIKLQSHYFAMPLFYVSILIGVMQLTSCSAKPKLTNDAKYYLSDINCPEGGDCVFEVKKNATLQIKQDDFGKLYPTIEEGSQLVILYTFSKKQEKGKADGHYKEMVYFEINPKTKHLSLKDKQLQNIKMLYGRICFCKDFHGYFLINHGYLNLFNSNRQLNIRSNFELPKIPHKINTINESIKY